MADQLTPRVVRTVEELGDLPAMERLLSAGLVRHGDRVWVQDEESARVERWETGRMSPGGDVWDHDWLSWWPEYRRPVLSNGWTGPWVPVEGGAE